MRTPHRWLVRFGYSERVAPTATGYDGSPCRQHRHAHWCVDGIEHRPRRNTYRGGGEQLYRCDNGHARTEVSRAVRWYDDRVRGLREREDQDELESGIKHFLPSHSMGSPRSVPVASPSTIPRVGEAGWRLGITRRDYVAIEDGERPPSRRIRGDRRVLRAAVPHSDVDERGVLPEESPDYIGISVVSEGIVGRRDWRGRPGGGTHG